MVGDHAVALALLVCDQDPVEFGFGSAKDRCGRADGRPVIANYGAEQFGFWDDTARAAAHAKAKAWLDKEPKEKKDESKRDPAVLKLVEQLGAPEFVDREAAAKKLRAIGVTAIPALQAGTRDPSPEVRKRSQEVLTAVRADARDALAKQFDPKKTEEYDHPVWKRFVAIAGDSLASRELFARIIATEKWVRTLDKAEAHPPAAGH